MAIRFSDFELDEQRFQLRLHDRRLAIRPKVFDLLVLLVRSRERVVLRDELVLAIWGTTAVGAGSLSGLVNELRQVLGEAGRGRSSVRTVHARGYQFVASVEAKEGDGSSEATKTAEVADAMETEGEGGGGAFGRQMDSIRASFEAVVCSGPRSAIVTGAVDSEWSVLDAWAVRALGDSGFEIVRSLNRVVASDSRIDFVDRLLEALVEIHGIDSLRSMIPVRSHELFERYATPRACPGIRAADALAARQYEGRILRGAAELLSALCRDQPIAFLFDAWDSPPEGIASMLSPLLEMLGDSRVFVLGRTKASAGEGDADGPGEWVDSKIDWIEWVEGALSDSSVADCDRMNVFLEARGIDALPRALATALVAHVRDDEHSLSLIASWLGSEVRNAPSDSNEATPSARPVRMRRVEPRRAARRSSAESR